MAVENTDQNAAAGTEVETNDAGASSAKDGELDMAEALLKALERAEKAEKDRDNYKEGMLKAKGKNQAGEKEGEDAAAVSPEVASALEKILLRSKELETAAAARAQIASGAQGASTDTSMKVGDNMLSDGQMQDLKARGWDDNKIARFKQNLMKSRA